MTEQSNQWIIFHFEDLRGQWGGGEGLGLNARSTAGERNEGAGRSLQLLRVFPSVSQKMLTLAVF